MAPVVAVITRRSRAVNKSPPRRPDGFFISAPCRRIGLWFQLAKIQVDDRAMLERTHFSYAPGTDRCALVTGPETVALWSFSAEEPPDDPSATRNPNFQIGRAHV